MNELEQLKLKVGQLENILNAFVRSDRYLFQKTLQISGGRNLLFSDSSNIRLDTGNGTMIGTSTDEKLGFFGTTPIVRPDLAYPNPSAGQIATVIVGLGLATPIT